MEAKVEGIFMKEKKGRRKYFLTGFDREKKAMTAINTSSGELEYLTPNKVNRLVRDTPPSEIKGLGRIRNIPEMKKQVLFDFFASHPAISVRQFGIEADYAHGQLFNKFINSPEGANENISDNMLIRIYGLLKKYGF